MPPVAFITWPTTQPARDGLARACATLSGLAAITSATAASMAEVVAANPDKAAQAQAKPSLAGWFVGQVMKATGGKANPQAVNAMVKAKLGID